MTKQQILKTIQDKMWQSDEDIFSFVDWLREFIEQEVNFQKM